MNDVKTSLWKMAIPLIVSFWLRSLFTFVDTIYASFLGDEAIAAIGLAIPLEFGMIAIWVGLSTALTSYYAEAVGEYNERKLKQITQVALRVLSAVIPTFLGIGIGVYALAPRLELEAEVARNFQIYGAVLIGGSALTGFWSTIPDSIVKAFHDTKSTMIAGLCSNFTNLAFNTIFLFGFGWGIFGIAFSTVLGRLAGLSYALWRASSLRRSWQKNSSKYERKTAILKRPLRKILALAFPAGLSHLLMIGEGIWINFLLSMQEDATAALAAYGIYFRIGAFALTPIVATRVAFLPFVARHRSLGNLDLIYRNYLGAIWMGGIYALFVVWPLCHWGGESLMSYLTHSSLVISQGTLGIRFVPWICLSWLPYQFSKSLLEGFQRAAPTLFMSLLRYVVLALPLTYLGVRWAKMWGYSSLFGVLCGLLVSTLLSSLFYFVWGMRFLSSENCQNDSI
ncbi:MAG: MATE family efflux transporter [Planctomycetota bacterium]|nr:MAG: MATE family efflux transporter [Planctomycetota bacterium]